MGSGERAGYKEDIVGGWGGKKKIMKSMTVMKPTKVMQ